MEPSSASPLRRNSEISQFNASSLGEIEVAKDSPQKIFEATVHFESFEKPRSLSTHTISPISLSLGSLKKIGKVFKETIQTKRSVEKHRLPQMQTKSKLEKEESAGVSRYRAYLSEKLGLGSNGNQELFFSRDPIHRFKGHLNRSDQEIAKSIKDTGIDFDSLVEEGERLGLPRREIVKALEGTLRVGFEIFGYRSQRGKELDSKVSSVVEHLPIPVLSKTSCLPEVKEGKTSAASIVPGWEYYDDSNKSLRNEDVGHSAAGAVGVDFITGKAGLDLVAKATKDIVSNMFSSYLLSRFNIESPKTAAVSNEGEISTLQKLCKEGAKNHKFILMEKVIGKNLTSIVHGSQYNDAIMKDKEYYFTEIGKLCMLDAFLMPDADRIGIKKDGRHINGENIMINASTRSIVAIDNDTDLHKDQISTDHLSLLADREQSSMLFSSFTEISMGLFIDPETAEEWKEAKCELDNSLLPHFQDGLEKGRGILIKAFTSKKGKQSPMLDRRKVEAFVDEFVRLHPVDDKVRGNLIRSISQRCRALI